MPSVIRREQHASLRTFSLADVERDAAAAVALARSDAETLLSRARHDADELLQRRRDEAYELGLVEGRKDGEQAAQREAEKTALSEARERLARLATVLQNALDEFNRSKARLLAEAETGLIELALSIARRVCKRQAAGDATVARANAVHLLESVRHGDDLELRVSVQEHESLRKSVQEFLDATDRHEHVSVIADATIAHGDCVLRTREGEIDATIDAQLDAIAAALTPSALDGVANRTAEARRTQSGAEKNNVDA